MYCPFRKVGAWAALLSMVLSTGCASYEGPFVHKTEQELDIMEAEAAQVASKSRDMKIENTASDAEMQVVVASMEERLRPMAEEPTVSQPLYQMELATLELLKGDHAQAHDLLMKARNHIELLFDPQLEERAVSIWHGENNKVFKGEPHERATMYALLALSFIEQGNYEDAERCVKNGLFADASNEDETYVADYALLHYLGYVSAMYRGDVAQAEEYKREFEAAFNRKTPALNAQMTPYQALFKGPLPNAFLAMFSKYPPTYERAGSYEEERLLISNPSYSQYITYAVDGGTEYEAPMCLADIHFQASTRGGREMDGVLRNKATIKKGMEASGNVLLIIAVGSFVAAGHARDAALPLLCISGAAFLAGISFHAIGALINSQADVRYWKSLPGEFVLIPLHLPEGKSANVKTWTYHLYDRIGDSTYTVTPGLTAPSVQYVNHYPLEYGGAITPRLEQDKATQRAAGTIGDMGTWMKYEVTE